ncbi:hypothetical protein [Moorena sp. SIO4G3]|nr:hypothetical protein [Moorena sp. SIO4G3]
MALLPNFTHSLFPVPYSLFPIPCSLFPVPITSVYFSSKQIF